MVTGGSKGIFQLVLNIVCLGIALLCGRNWVTGARAFSTSLTFNFRHTSSGSRYPAIQSTRGGALFTVTGDENDEPLEQKGTPATGWNHNKPKSSKFWQSANGEPASAEAKTTKSPPKTTVRTGWLHNTEPTTKKVEEEQKVGGISRAQQRLKQAMMQQERNHRIVSPPTFHACGNERQIVVTEHRLSIPVYQPDQKTPRIDLAFTIVEEVKDEATQKWFNSLSNMLPQQRATAYIEKAALKNADEMMVYLQGGPGFGSPTPVVGLAFSQDSSWGAKALNKYKRIILMDQRGTGKSTPITKQSLETRFPNLFLLDKKGKDLESLASSHAEEHSKFQEALSEATHYMAQFRADNIVQDAEYVREALMLSGEPGSESAGPRPWGCALGQSFGGFCMMAYLSLVEHPPKICLLTGGIAPMLTPAYDAYSSLWERVKERNLCYYDMYPGDIPLIKKIVKKLSEEPVTLPSGGTLTARRFLQFGLGLGGSPSSFASLHNLFQSAFLVPGEAEFTRSFLKQIDNDQPFDDHPIYYFLHESIYADGPKHSPTNWAAHRAYENKIKTPSEFDYRLTCQMDSDKRPTMLFGEMVFPWMSEDYAECGGIGCTALASALATKDDWGPLYDGDHMRKVLAEGRSRAAAAVYYDDLYVDFDCSMKVAARGGPLEKAKIYITNEYQHSGLRDDGASIFIKLHGMATGSVRTPS